MSVEVPDHETSKMLAQAGFELSPSPMWVFDMETLSFLAVNKAAERVYGYSSREFLAMTILDIRPKEDIAPLLKEHFGEHKHHIEGEAWVHRKKNGGLIRVEITSHQTIFNRRPAEIVSVTIKESLSR